MTYIHALALVSRVSHPPSRRSLFFPWRINRDCSFDFHRDSRAAGTRVMTRNRVVVTTYSARRRVRRHRSWDDNNVSVPRKALRLIRDE